jgi:hypothetical protein
MLRSHSGFICLHQIVDSASEIGVYQTLLGASERQNRLCGILIGNPVLETVSCKFYAISSTVSLPKYQTLNDSGKYGGVPCSEGRPVALSTLGKMSHLRFGIHFSFTHSDSVAFNEAWKLSAIAILQSVLPPASYTSSHPSFKNFGRNLVVTFLAPSVRIILPIPSNTP